MSLSNFVKRVRNIMRNDAGINGNAQRIEQMAWMLFLKVYDEKENDWELIDSDCNFDLCKFPKEDEEILPPAELLADYFKKRKALDHEIDKTLAEIQHILGIEVKVDEL